MTVDPRRARRLIIAPQLWLDGLRALTAPDPPRHTFDPPLPADLTVLDADLDLWDKQRVILLVASSTFEMVPPGAAPPDWWPTIIRHFAEAVPQAVWLEKTPIPARTTVEIVLSQTKTEVKISHGS